MGGGGRNVVAESSGGMGNYTSEGQMRSHGSDAIRAESSVSSHLKFMASEGSQYVTRTKSGAVGASMSDGAMLGANLPDNIDTILFVDVDGVLNIGAKEGDSGVAPLLLNEDNAQRANRFQESGVDLAVVAKKSKKTAETAERMMAVLNRKIPDEDSTYASLVCGTKTMLSPVLVDRLATIIRMSGPNCAAVLSSSWRKKRHAGRVAELEAAVSKHLGEPFAFRAATPWLEERTPGDRLRCLGSFIQKLVKTRMSKGSELLNPLRLLVLEDFFISAPKKWATFGCPADTVPRGEDYLKGFAPKNADLDVKIIHTYDEWAQPSGLQVSIGAGLNGRAMLEATRFLKIGSGVNILYEIEALPVQAPPTTPKTPSMMLRSLPALKDDDETVSSAELDELRPLGRSSEPRWCAWR